MTENDNDTLYTLDDDMDDAGDTLYSIPEDKEPAKRIGQGEEDLPYAYGVDDPDEPADGAEEGIVTRNPLGLLVGAMLWPVSGWRNLKRAKLPVEKMAAGCFIPLALIASLSIFINFIYQANQTWALLSVQAVTTFLAYIFSYFLLPVAAHPFVDKKVNETLATPFGRNAVMLLLSTLTIFRMLMHLLPSLEPVVVFMPIWTIYMTYRLVPMLKTPKEKQSMTTVILSILTVGLPQAWLWLLNLLLAKG